jgi:MauM/NapG family ferredoxin protein
LPEPPLRPPGARSEADLAARCIRCDRCAAVCPYRSIKPAPWGLGPDAGTPLVVARETPCWLCMRCPPVCPTGALEPLTDRRAVRMGVAWVNEQSCYAFQGIVCRTCVDQCPLAGEAIRQDDQLRPVVTDRCTGCGVCEHRCPAPEAAIRVEPFGRRA